MKTLEEKLDIVDRYNSFYINDKEYEKLVSDEINGVTNLVKSYGKNLTPKRLGELMEEDPLRTFDFLITASGISKETWKSILTYRSRLPKEVRGALNASNWAEDWKATESNYRRGLTEDAEFRKGVVGLFTEGHKIKSFCRPSDQEKFNIKVIRDLAESSDAVIKRVVASGRAGGNRAVKALREEEIPRRILRKLGVPYETGVQVKFERNMDTVVPDKDNPILAIENSFYQTTNSTQTEKAKRFISCVGKMKKNYDTTVVLFIGGVGWQRRRSSLIDMLSVADDVFTYSRSQLKRFEEFILNMNVEVVAA